MKNTWSNNGEAFKVRPTSNDVARLPLGIYEIVPTMQGPILNRKAMKFDLPPKLYGNPQMFASRVVKTFDESPSNVGVLLNGARGTGKTVTAQLIAEMAKKPIILAAGPAGFDILSDIQDDVVVFIDEFEKVFPDGGGSRMHAMNDDSSPGGEQVSLLSMMDGAQKASGRRLWVLTTNELRVNQNMIQRPGRIRYVKEYGNLPADSVREIVEDQLLDKNRCDGIVEFIAQLELITVDIVMEIVREVNIHGEMPSEFASFFNVKKIQNKWIVFEVVRGKDGAPTEKILSEGCRLNYTHFEAHNEDDPFYAQHGTRTIHAQIVEYIDYDMVKIKWNEGKRTIRKTIRIQSQASYNRVFQKYPKAAFAYGHAED